MKLQINNKGSWKDVLEFDNVRAAEVEDAAASLSRAAGGVKLAMLDDDGTRRYLTTSGGFRGLAGEH